MKLKKIMLTCVLSLTPITLISLISCAPNNFLETNDQYTETYNFPNDNSNFSLFKKNDISRKINNLISTKLFRIVSQDKPIIDFINNKVLKPSKMFYKFEQATSIKIIYENDLEQFEELVFDKDTIKDTSFDKLASGDPANPETYLAPENPEIGYKHLYKFISSDDPKSINSSLFQKALKKAKKIEIFVENNKNPWLNNDFQQTNHALTIQDFKLGFLKSIMLSKTNRDLVLQNKDLINEDTKITQNNSYFNQDNILEYLSSNNIDISEFLNPNFVLDNKPLTFNLKTDGSFLTSDWSEVFKNIFLFDNVTDALPSFNFDLNFKTPNVKNFEFLYEYGKNINSLFYSSYYYVVNNSLDNIKLYKNKYYLNNTNWQQQYRLNEINFKFNVLPINSQTFNIQTFNAFNQNLNSSLNFNTLDELQKQAILNNFSKYNLNYQKTYQMYNNQTPLILNLFPHSNDLYFNDAFSNLYYGLNKDKLKKDYKLKDTINENTLIFRSLINNVINPYILSNINNSDSYLSQAPSGIFISAIDNNNSNYKNIVDGVQQISKQIILNNNLEKANHTTSYDNKLKAQQLDNITNYNTSLKSTDFWQIKAILKPILDEYFKNNTNTNEVIWTIPINNIKGLYSIKKISNIIETIFNQLDNRLKPEIKLIENEDEYNLFFRNNSSIYNENIFQISTPDTTSFLYKYLTQNNYKNLLEFLYIYDVIKDKNAYPEINQFIRNLQTEFQFTNYAYTNEIFKDFKYSNLKEFENYLQKFDNENFNWTINKFNSMLLSFLTNYAKRNTTFTILNLINEISNVTSYTISFDNFISLNNYSKNLLQKYIMKPASYYNLEYLQDILIEKEKNEK